MTSFPRITYRRLAMDRTLDMLLRNIRAEVGRMEKEMDALRIQNHVLTQQNSTMTQQLLIDDTLIRSLKGANIDATAKS
jgi:RecA/RadA recombinase